MPPASASQTDIATQRRNIGVLAACQALLLANTSALVALSGVAGYELAQNKSLATLPVTGWVVGGAATTMLASQLMQRIGRRGGFTVGALIGIVGALVCVTALALHSFWLLCLGSLVFGSYNAFGQYYRFAAADAATPEFRARAISYNCFATLTIINGVFVAIAACSPSARSLWT